MAEKQINRILIQIDGHWGELDWILPVCRYIKDNYPQVIISVLFNKHDFGDTIRGNDFLYDLLTHCVDNYYDLGYFLPPLLKRLTDVVRSPAEKDNIVIKIIRYARHKIVNFVYTHLAKGLEEKIVALTNPDVLVKNIGTDAPFRRKITSLVRERGGSVVVVSHGADPLLDMFPPSQYEEKSCDGDILLCDNYNMSKIYGGTYRLKSAVVGTPRYDSWWIEYLQTRWKQKGCQVKRDSSKQYTIAFITRGPHRYPLSRETFEYLMYETLRVVFSFPDTYLVIKPHPRQSRIVLEKFLRKYDKSRWQIDSTSILGSASSIDLAISMWSTTILDALAAGIPVIEFFRFEGSDYQWSQEEDGTLTTAYRKLGLVAPANNAEELAFWINRFRQEPDVESKSYLNNFRKQVPESTDSATRMAASFVLGK